MTKFASGNALAAVGVGDDGPRCVVPVVVLRTRGGKVHGSFQSAVQAIPCERHADHVVRHAPDCHLKPKS